MVGLSYEAHRDLNGPYFMNEYYVLSAFHLPHHQHIHECTGYSVSGCLKALYIPVSVG